MKPNRLPCVAAVVLATACAAADGPSDEIRRVLAVADARPVSADSVAILVDALRSPAARLRQQAARSIGRLERPGHVPDLVPHLEDADPAVRAEVANALGQAVHRTDASEVRPLLLERLGVETDAVVRGALAHTLGRLRADSVSAAAVAVRLAEAVPAAPDARLGVALGFFHLARQAAAGGAFPAAALEALRMLAGSEGSEDATRTRTLATAALGAAGALSDADVERALADPEPAVRREAVLVLGRRDDRAARDRLLAALDDPHPSVRYDALRGLGPADCAAVDASLDDGNPHVGLLAIDLSGECAPTAARVERLDSVAGALAGGDWHRPAHALAALAKLAPDRVGAHLPSFVEHADPFVRAWAARAAAGHRALLQSLTEDGDANVRIAALQTLARYDLPSARAAARLALPSSDGELAMVAAGILEGSDADVVPALFDALDRLTAARRQTSRDPRASLLARIAELGTPVDSTRLAVYVTDFDPVIATRAAALFSTWTGRSVAPAPHPPAAEPFPTTERLDRLAADTVVMTMEDGAVIRVALFPWLAPTNAARFARLAMEGWYDGLTFHRIVPNFVVQGGSPGANEYVGAGPFSRDELGLQGNWRGTVGLSTRGRDTGDAQLYINLVDNNRLDHDYTVFGTVVEGMEAVDRLLEGARIRTIRLARED